MSYQTKYTAQELANLLKLNVDTVRKRAKKGLIPGLQDSNGRWTFITADLITKGILSPQTGSPTPPTLQAHRLTDVIFVLDRSGSMGSLIGQARKNLQAQIDELKKAADSNNTYRVSVINFDDNIITTANGTDVRTLNNASSLYLHPNGMTKLYDAIMEAMNLANTLDTRAKDHAFLISVITDGMENASYHRLEGVKARLTEAQRTDRYTFTYAGPPGSHSVATMLGMPVGNTTTWDQTFEGIQTLGVVSNVSLSSYTNSRSRGVTSSTSFYAQPVTPDASKFAVQLDNKLDDVSGQVKVERVTASDPVVINKFCEKKFGSFPKGHIYYQLTESEKVQDYKKLIVQDTATGNFYAGETAAKKLLGVPKFQGTVRLKPGSLGEFKVFVQSTSVNRKLTPGTVVVYLP